MTVFEGVLVAAVTPRSKSSHHIDLGASLEVVDFLCSAGVRGIAVLGSTGEFLNFDLEDRARLVSMAVKRSRVPILANISHTTLDGSVKLAREAGSAGAAGLLLMPPPFFRYGQAEVREFFLRFVDEAGDSTPILLYNIPFFTSEIAPETAVELLSTGLFSGIKDSSGRWDYFCALKTQSEKKLFTLLIGNDVIFTRGRSAGANGVVSGVACAVPELMLGLDQAIVAGAGDKIARLEARLQEFIAWLDRFPAPIGVKEAASLRGIQGGPLATPLGADGARQIAEFREWFQAWLPAVQKEVRDD